MIPRQRRDPEAAAELQPCGTDGAWQRHVLADEQPCAACVEAHRVTQAGHQARYKAEGRRRSPKTRATERLVAAHQAEFQALLAEEIPRFK